MCMEEQYKGHVIRVTTEKDGRPFPWNQFAEYWMERRESLLNRSTGRFGYDTPDQAEKAGMLISKKWIDAAKPLSPGAASAGQMSDF